MSDKVESRKLHFSQIPIENNVFGAEKDSPGSINEFEYKLKVLYPSRKVFHVVHKIFT